MSFLSIYLSIYSSIYLPWSSNLSIYLYLFVFLCFYLSIVLFTHIFLLFIHINPPYRIYLVQVVYLSLYVSFSIFLSICPSIHSINYPSLSIIRVLVILLENILLVSLCYPGSHLIQYSVSTSFRLQLVKTVCQGGFHF